MANGSNDHEAANVSPAPPKVGPNSGQNATPRPSGAGGRRSGTLWRITTNYARLAATFGLGLVQVPLLIYGLGEAGFGLVLLLGSTTGIASVLSNVITGSMVRELGRGYHHSRRRFLSAFQTGVALAAIGAVVVMIAALAMMPLLSILRIPSDLLIAARWFLMLSALGVSLDVLVNPWRNLLLVEERMAESNVWIVVLRAQSLVAAIVVAVVAHGAGVSASTLVITYGVVLTSLGGLTLLLLAARQIVADRQLLPMPTRARRRLVGGFLIVGGWNFVNTLAMNLLWRAPQFVMNAFFGLTGNLIYGIGVQLAGYIQMVALGISDGLQAVAVRLSGVRHKGSSIVDSYTSMRRLLVMNLWLTALAVIPTVGFIATLTEPLLHAWLGSRLESPQQLVPQIAVVTRLLAGGIAAISVAGCLTRVLYGAGMVRQYATLTITSGAGSIGLSVLLVLVLPNEWRIYGPSLAVVTMALVVQAILLPTRTATLLGGSPWAMARPFVEPILATGIAIVCSLTVFKLVMSATNATAGTAQALPALAAATLAFGAIYLAAVAALLRLAGVHLRDVRRKKFTPGPPFGPRMPVAWTTAFASPDRDAGRPTIGGQP